MKKSKALVAALLAAVVTMGAGYAAWTDKLTINNTVSTGEFKVEFVEQNRWGQYPRIMKTDGTSKEYVTATISQNNPNKTTVTVGNMYPNTLVKYDVKFENKGTIPAVLKDGDIKVNFTKKSDALNKNLIVAGGFLHFNSKGFVKGGDVFLGTLGEFQTQLNTMLRNTRMEPGDYITFDIGEEQKEKLATLLKQQYNVDDFILQAIKEDNCVNFILPHTVSNADLVENQETIFDIELNFTQHNVK